MGIVLAFAAVAVQADPDFKACAGFEDNSYVDPWKLTINPDPIVAKEGESVTVHFDATVLKTLPVGTNLDIKLKKNGIPLPCLPVPGLPISVGSCKYDANDLLALIPAEDCTKFPPLARPAPCPSTPDSTETRTPTVPSPLSSQRSPPSSSPSSQERSLLRPRPCSMTEQSTSASRTLSKFSPIRKNFKKKPCLPSHHTQNSS